MIVIYPQLDPFVQQATVVEFTEKPSLSNSVGRIAHLATTASDVTKVVVALLTQYGRATHQRNRLLILKIHQDATFPTFQVWSPDKIPKGQRR